MGLLMGNTIDNSGSFNRPNLSVGQSAARLLNPAGPEGPRAAGPSSTGSEHVSFSDSVAMLQRIQSQIDAQPAVDSAAVDAARAAIDDGSYQINHEQIASKLLALDKELP